MISKREEKNLVECVINLIIARMEDKDSKSKKKNFVRARQEVRTIGLEMENNFPKLPSKHAIPVLGMMITFLIGLIIGGL